MASFVKPKRFTADGALDAAGVDCLVDSITIETDGTNAATVAIREGGSGGTIVWQGISEGAVRSRFFAFPRPIYVSDAFVDLTGTGAGASVTYEAVS